jgi:hypothetical protein
MKIVDVWISPAAQNALSEEDMWAALHHHFEGDWRAVNEQEWKESEAALEGGFHPSSAYITSGGTMFVISTNANRSMAMVMLPNECLQHTSVSH